MKTNKPLVIKSNSNENKYLCHSGHSHYYGNQSDAMEYYDTVVAQALADKYNGVVIPK